MAPSLFACWAMMIGKSHSSHRHSKTDLRSDLGRLRTKNAADHQSILGQEAFWDWLDFLNLGAGSIVGGYMPLRYENDPRDLMKQCLHRGFGLGLCVMSGEALIFRHYDMDVTPLSPKDFGVLEPDETSPSVQPHLVLVPLLGFDFGLHRLGYGKGFYDRTMAQMRSAKPCWFVGLAQTYQRLETVYPESHDQALDAVLTPTQFWRRDQINNI